MAKSYSVRFRGCNNPNYSGKGRRECDYCRREYRSYDLMRRYCSRVCSVRAHIKDLDKYTLRKSRTGIPRRKRHRPCRRCRRNVKKGRIFCRRCSPRGKRITLSCSTCHKRFQRRPSEAWECQNHYCSRSCYRKLGKSNPNWRGGITPVNRRIRTSLEYQQWRRAVFERDRYTCVWCGQHGGTLHADHIKSFATHPSLRLVVANGRTLCLECHKKTPTYLTSGKRRLSPI